MRALPLLALLAVPTSARADSFIEIAGGIMNPVEDEQWTDYVDSGPKLAARVGGSSTGKVGGLFSVDWTPIDTEDSNFGAFDVDADRFRILGSVTTQSAVGTNLTASLRFGGGIDIHHVNVRTNFGGFSSEESDTDSGIALEAAGGLWFTTSSGGIMIGGELALPLSFHDDGNGDDIDLEEYSSFDIDIMLGVRFLQR